MHVCKCHKCSATAGFSFSLSSLTDLVVDSRKEEKRLKIRWFGYLFAIQTRKLKIPPVIPISSLTWSWRASTRLGSQSTKGREREEGVDGVPLVNLSNRMDYLPQKSRAKWTCQYLTIIQWWGSVKFRGCWSEQERDGHGDPRRTLFLNKRERVSKRSGEENPLARPSVGCWFLIGDEASRSYSRPVT